MWDRVVHMEQIQVLVFSHRGHLRCEGQRVRLMLKKWVRHHLDFVKTHPLVQLRQACGQCGGDEMHDMAALCQLFSEFRANDAAAAVSWIDCDADVHEWVSMQCAESGRQLECGTRILRMDHGRDARATIT